MKNIEKITDRKELFEFLFLVDIIYCEDENEKQTLIRRAMKKAEELGVASDFAKELSSLEDIRKKEEAKAHSCDNEEPETDKNGNLLKSIHNYRIIFEKDDYFSSLCFNELSGRAEFEKSVWNDSKQSLALYYIEKKYGLKSERDFEHALKVILSERRYHPVREKITSLTWDKKPRIEQFLQRIMGAEDSDYTRECSRLIFHCATARIFNPGCKVDDVIVLQGQQGNGKSTLVSWLCMNEDWYGRVNDIKGNVGIEQIQGKWICEISELLAVTGKEKQEEAKQYLDRKSDNYRRPYAQYSEEIPRQCIFIGTTNLRQPFSDKTGNRRYFPVWCNIKPGELYEREKAVKKYIEQCWAEAYDLWTRGQIRHSVKKEMFAIVAEKQKNATEDDWRVGIIESFLADKTETCVLQIWSEALGMSDKPKRGQSLEIALILDGLENWEKGEGTRYMGDFKNQRFWKRKETTVFRRINDDFVEIIDDTSAFRILS